MQSHATYLGATSMDVVLFTTGSTWKLEVIYKPSESHINVTYGYVGTRLSLSVVISPLASGVVPVPTPVQPHHQTDAVAPQDDGVSTTMLSDTAAVMTLRGSLNRRDFVRTLTANADASAPNVQDDPLFLEADVSITNYLLDAFTIDEFGTTKGNYTIDPPPLLPSEESKPYLWHDGYSIGTSINEMQAHVSYRGAAAINVVVTTIGDTWEVQVIFNPPQCSPSCRYGYIGKRLSLHCIVEPPK
eukprot:m.205141 g.205141  ORF g.205141 m.205141 type:complete len:244 (-) comp22815_c0_seq1:80-811(-)